MKAWTLRWATLTVAASAPMAFADFDGPAPVAWRWAQSTTAAPAGKPVVAGDTVYVAVGGRVYALDRLTGNTIWRYPVADPLPSSFRTGLTMSEGTLVAATDNRTIYAIDAQSGNVKWQWTSENTVTGAPVVAGGHVVIATMPKGLMSLDAATGKPDWTTPLDLKGSPYPNMTVWQDSVICMTNAPSIVSVNPSTAKINWTVRASQLSGLSAPVAFGDSIYLNTGNYLTALRGATGGKKWDQRMDENLAFSPAVSDSGIAVVSATGTVWTLDTTGKFVFKKGIDLGSSPVAPPSFVGKLVAIGTENGSLNVVNPLSGDTVFNYTIPPLFKGAMASTGTGGETEVKYSTVAGPATSFGDTLLVLARDGSLLAFDKSLGVDLTPPAVDMFWPNPGDQVAGQPPLEIWFKILDAASGVNPSTVSVTIGGNPYASTYFKEGYLMVKVSAVGTNRPLADGRAPIVVNAADWLGNKVEMQFVLSIDNTLPATGGPPQADDPTKNGTARGGGRKGGAGGGQIGGAGG